MLLLQNIPTNDDIDDFKNLDEDPIELNINQV